ncbi:MAG: hemerythrin domain-containing protein [Alphaproteobacteria bacterium]|nr:hemerythrin domain-containing protein [Alphaproteobacteria bacterium]
MPTKPNAGPEQADQETKSTGRATNTRALAAIELLKDDHREVQEYFEQYEGLGSDGEKEPLALKICLALQVHAQIEEEIFYPEVRSAIKNRELIDKALVEHAAAKELVAEIEAMEVGDELRDAKVKVLGDQIRHHVAEEENELFPQLHQADLDMALLGQRLADRKAELLREVAEGADPG